jgi:hypothetical protein
MLLMMMKIEGSKVDSVGEIDSLWRPSHSGERNVVQITGDSSCAILSHDFQLLIKSWPWNLMFLHFSSFISTLSPSCPQKCSCISLQIHFFFVYLTKEQNSTSRIQLKKYLLLLWQTCKTGLTWIYAVVPYALLGFHLPLGTLRMFLHLFLLWAVN